MCEHVCVHVHMGVITSVHTPGLARSALLATHTCDVPGVTASRTVAHICDILPARQRVDARVCAKAGWLPWACRTQAGGCGQHW